MEIKQQLRLSQQLVMTPQLQQAIKLLQMSRMELVDMVREELLEANLLTAAELVPEQLEGLLGGGRLLRSLLGDGLAGRSTDRRRSLLDVRTAREEPTEKQNDEMACLHGRPYVIVENGFQLQMVELDGR